MIKEELEREKRLRRRCNHEKEELAKEEDAVKKEKKKSLENGKEGTRRKRRKTKPKRQNKLNCKKYDAGLKRKEEMKEDVQETKRKGKDINMEM